MRLLLCYRLFVSGLAESPLVTDGLPQDGGTTVKDASPKFTCLNEYNDVQGSAWQHLAEPFRETTLEASSTVGDPEENVFIWTFDDNTVLEGR